MTYVIAGVCLPCRDIMIYCRIWTGEEREILGLERLT